MKNIICIILIACIFFGCEKEGGTLSHKIKYSTSPSTFKSVSKSAAESYYSDLGTYVTSITPRHFSAKLNIMMYYDFWESGDNSSHMISYIEGHDNDPNYEISLYVDFSNNQEVTYEPILYCTDGRDGLFGQKQVSMRYFYFVPYYFIQEIEIPEEYGDEIPSLGYEGTYSTDPITGKQYYKVNQLAFLEKVFGVPDHHPYGYLFGNTDRTYIFNEDCTDLPQSEEYPCGGSQPLIRSNKYNAVTVTVPDKGEEVEMYSTISFDTENLIQVYAGNDNVPYTMDDIFVYAPNYWERISVKLEIR